ncbi:unnamed protein product [Euphydryas editha]|uniref:Uncharacterized protein n=1 Tax=Euphydryas editha TaxID=104508 RepID=A0AAU9TE89_EUPED|nr:unnamed protein product [Euphydryas editha]
MTDSREAAVTQSGFLPTNQHCLLSSGHSSAPVVQYTVRAAGKLYISVRFDLIHPNQNTADQYIDGHSFIQT